MAIVHIPLRLKRLEMSGRYLLALFCHNGDGFYPMECVLKKKTYSFLLQGDEQLVRYQRIRRTGTKIEKKRALLSQDTLYLACPFARPSQILFAALSIFVISVLDTQIVRWGGNDNIH